MIHPTELNSIVLSSLNAEYVKKLNRLQKDEPALTEKLARWNVFKRLRSEIKLLRLEVTKYKNLFHNLEEVLKDLHQMNICSIEGSTGNTFAKSILGFKGDVLLITSPEILTKRNFGSLIQLHFWNVKYANEFVQLSLSRFVSFIKKIKGILRGLLTLISIFPSIGLSVTLVQNDSPDAFSKLLYYLIPVVVPALVYKFLPRLIIRYVIPLILKRSVK